MSQLWIHLCFATLITSLAACPSDAPSAPDDKPSLFDQVQDPIDDTQNNDAGNSNSNATSLDGGTTTTNPGTADGGTTATPPTSSADAGSQEEVWVPVGDGGVSHPILNSDLPGCRLGDVWMIDIHSVPPAGEGCQTGGGVAQGDLTQQLKVVTREGGGLSVQLIVPSTANADYHFIHGDLFEEGLSCRLVAHLETGFNFANDVNHDNQTTQVWMAYDYHVLATQSVVTGEGLMSNGFLAFPDANNLDQATAVDINERCSEPLEMAGSILAQ